MLPVGNNLQTFDHFRVDLEKKILWSGDSLVDLPVKAAEMLCMLIERKGEVVSKEELLTELWTDSFVEEGVLTQNIYVLRKTLEKFGAKRSLIETVPRFGYRFAGEVFDEETVEITLERQTFERKFVSESVVYEDISVSETGGDNVPKNSQLSGRKLGRFVAAGVVVVLILGLIGAAWIYPRYANNGTENSGGSRKSLLVAQRITESGRAYYVGLAPDNQNAAYVIHTPENKYSLILHHLATKSDTVVIEPQDAHINCIHFSPDGNYIYYAAQHGKEPNTVFRIPIYGGPSQVVVKDVAHHYTVSPDGEWLAFYRWELGKAVHIEICKSEDGSDRRIVSSKSGNETYKVWGIAPEWSPDGKRLVAVAAKRPDAQHPYSDELVEVNIADGKVSQIKTPDWYRIGQPYWKEDGSGLFSLVRKNQGEPVQIWELDYPSGTGKNLTNDDSDYREFRPASDASFFMAATWSQGTNLFVVEMDNPSNTKQLTFDTKTQNGGAGLQWTVDGKSLLYIRQVHSTGNLWNYDLETNKNRQITLEKTTDQSYLDVTNDGKSAVFGSNKKGTWNIWQVDLDGRNLRQITNGTVDGAPEMSPDGKWLYYVDDGLWKKPIDGGPSQKIMQATPGTTRVSPTDPTKLISYYPDPNEKSSNKWKFILYSETNPDSFEELDIESIIFFDWKPDGSGIYYADRGEGFNNLWFLSIKDMKKTKITEFADQRISNLRVSPDGKSIAISRGSSTGSILKLSGFNK